MPKTTFEVKIKPSILTWARETIGKDVAQTAKRMGLSEKTIKKWEEGTKSPTMTQLKELAIFYKRPLAVFFLPEPPKELPLPTDFRTIPEEEQLPISTDTRLVIRKVRRKQEIIKKLESEKEEKYSQLSEIVNLNADPEELSMVVRKNLEISYDIQKNWKTENEAYFGWREAIENIGIYVFQYSMPMEEIRAFSLTDNEVPTIVVNLKDTIRGRIFSMLHELCHILIDDAGLCTPSKWQVDNHVHSKVQKIEKYCNHFAGAVLVPKGLLLSNDKVKKQIILDDWHERVLGSIANNFWVSKEVILRRLLIFGKTDNTFYQNKRAYWLKREPQQGGGGGRDLPKEVVSKNGNRLTKVVVNSYKNEKITYVDIADYLDTRVKHLPKIQQIIEAS